MEEQNTNTRKEEPTFVDPMAAFKPRQKMVFTQLARQLEFYFSKTNLSLDTYLQTLQNLNEGCVPVSILANFGKVKTILYTRNEQGRCEDVITAANLFSNQLQVVSIDTRTGKKREKEDDTATSGTIFAIGTTSGKPIDRPLAAQDSADSSSTTTTCSTLVLRDVHPQAAEEDVRGLFAFEGCPSIVHIARDVCFCWFVTLDSQDRDLMVHVMQQVQWQTLHGSHVSARLKSTTASAIAAGVPVDSFVLPIHPRKKKTRSKKKGKKVSSDPSQTILNDKAPKPRPATPPSLDSFPHLYKKVEWDASSPPIEYSSKQTTDGSSTATTTSTDDSKSTTKNQSLSFADVLRS